MLPICLFILPTSDPNGPAGTWQGKDTRLGHDPQRKTLGILGMGGIGRVCDPISNCEGELILTETT